MQKRALIKMDGKQTRSQAAKFLGTMKALETLPRDMQVKPLECQGTVIRLYCNRCAYLAEIPRDALEPALKVVNTLMKSSHTVESILAGRYYLLGHGCFACSETPVLTFEGIEK